MQLSIFVHCLVQRVFFLSVDPAELRCYSKIGASRGENNIPYPSE